MSEPSIDWLVKAYAQFLSHAWEGAHEIVRRFSHEGGMDDWRQANWEMLVEANLVKKGCRLAVYFAGADIYGDSSRVSDREVRATHRVIVRSAVPRLLERLSGMEVHVPDDGLPFLMLISVRDGWYREEPPFDAVLTHEDPAMVLALSDVRFELAPVVDGDD